MKRVIAVTLLLVAVVVAVAVGTGAGDSSKGYVVRANFRNAFTVNPGEEVKVAGVSVGTIRSLDVTPQQTAVVILDITKPGFGDFRQDASCTIRPQSLIGERFVECTPTQPRSEGQREAPALRTTKVDGEVQHVLPIQNTQKPIDIDLVANTLRLPYRQRLSIILSELGAGTAARGSDLRQIIRSGDPALKATDQVLDVLGQQNDVLNQLAKDSDTVLQPLADNSRSVSRFVKNAGETASATAERRSDLERTLQRLPEALRQLQPTMRQLDDFATQATPLVTDLNQAAPAATQVASELGPFARAGTPALQRLGDASEVGRSALLQSQPVISDLRTLASATRGVSGQLAGLLESLRSTGGVDQILNFVFSSTTAANGFDQFGHYIRANLLLNLCATYSTVKDEVCSAQYGDNPTDTAIPRASLSTVLAAATSKDATSLDRTAAVLRGVSAKALLADDPAEAQRTAARVQAASGISASGSSAAKGPSSSTGSSSSASKGGSASSGGGAISLPSQVLPGAAAAAAPTASAPAAAAPSAAPAATGSSTPAAPAADAGTTAAAQAEAPRSTQTQPATPAATSTSTGAAPSSQAQGDVTGALLDFLLGGGR